MVVILIFGIKQILHPTDNNIRKSFELFSFFTYSNFGHTLFTYFRIQSYLVDPEWSHLLDIYSIRCNPIHHLI